MRTTRGWSTSRSRLCCCSPSEPAGPARTRRRPHSEGRSVLRLEAGRGFYQSEAWLNYELASVVCDHLATTRGPETLWRLMDAFDGQQFSSAGEAEDFVRELLGRSPEQLRDDALAWARAA